MPPLFCGGGDWGRLRRANSAAPPLPTACDRASFARPPALAARRRKQRRLRRLGQLDRLQPRPGVTAGRPRGTCDVSHNLSRKHRRFAMEYLKRLEPLALVLVLIGALNWGIVGLFHENVVANIVSDGTVRDVIYAVVGFAGLVLLPRL